MLGDALRVYVGLTGVLILLTAATTSISGFGRLAYSLGEHDQLPRTFGRLHRRTLVAPQALVAAGAVSAITLVVVRRAARRPGGHARVALQLRRPRRVRRRPARRDPAPVHAARAPPPVPRARAASGSAAPSSPSSSVVGFVLTAAVMVVALWTHPGARYAGPIWLAAGVLLYVVVRRRHGERLTAARGLDGRAEAPGDALPAHPRADEDRRDRRGDGRDGRADRGRERRGRRGPVREPRAALAPARGGRRRRRRACRRVARRGTPARGGLRRPDRRGGRPRALDRAGDRRRRPSSGRPT